MDGTVLIADDDRGIRIVLTQALTRAGCRVHATGSLAQLMRWVEEGAGDLVITDVMMPDGNGLDLIPAIARARPDLPVIVISAQNSIVTAIRATEAAVFDYLPKPFDLPELMARVRAGLERRRQRTPAAPTPAPAPAPAPAASDGTALIGATPAMQALFREVARVVATDLPIVIAAEPGAGRSTLARALHMLGERRGGPLVTLVPGDPPEALAARLAEARGGTLIVEDPAAHDPATQLRLAVLLDAPPAEGPSPRLVATTGPDPLADIAAGRLSPELYYRLAGAVLALPPLRERLDDLPALARLMLERAGGQARELSPAALELLRAHLFPGNLRELDNLLRRLSLTAQAPRIEATEVAAALAATRTAPRAPRPDPSQPLAETVEQHLQRYFDLHGNDLPPPGLYDRIMRESERPLIQIALDACNGNQLRCAELLGLNRNTLRKKIAELDIQVTRRRRVM
ncbi:two-component system, NtrC family, nitrogen regulation response regulator GlnG [Paracoccus solventivorans]|uniref:DNA-binding transcriptional regulator NtrC n=1 Tax=Paracoccus solventivorans TaxID=53463 RepID=A0A1M7FNH0_9RHOB|nr:sigma-54 dependent transcriptional regulator [Paracoccus solventivorans]SHM05594.1 two-component system, NtrC family, nitrogen regulation response regulator GlnG [Paracoccus solventivorans]